MEAFIFFMLKVTYQTASHYGNGKPVLKPVCLTGGDKFPAPVSLCLKNLTMM